MNLRKTILIFCLVSWAILFVDGVNALTQIGKPSINNSKVKNQNIRAIQNELIDESGISFDRPVNLLVLGLDDEEVRSDVIMLFNYDPVKNIIKVISFARDTRVYVKGKPVKINALIGIGKEKMIIDRITKMTGFNIDYYLTVNFKGFRKFINTLGGVKFNVPITMNYDDPIQDLHIHLKKGSQILDGNKAEQLVRYRKGYQDGDIGRIKIQQEFIKEIVNQKLNLRYLSKADEIYEIIRRYMRTNIEFSDITYYLKYVKNINLENIKTYTLPGETEYINNIWYFIYDKDKTKELIKEHFKVK